MSLQPMPLSAMQMVSEDPIRMSQKRIAECDGGKVLSEHRSRKLSAVL
jgi:hypothetical protein